jgi:hypothetical protein
MGRSSIVMATGRGEEPPETGAKAPTLAPRRIRSEVPQKKDIERGLPDIKGTPRVKSIRTIL